MLITEKLMLLLTKTDGRAEGWGSNHGYAYAAAAITDLIIAQRLTLSPDKDPRVTVLSPQPTGHPGLDAALARVGQKNGAKLSSLVQDGKLDRSGDFSASLSTAGIFSVTPKQMLGLVPEKRVELDPEPERVLRQRLHVVLHGADAQPDEAALLALLQGLGVVSKVLSVETQGLSKREIKARIEEVSRAVGQTGTAVAKAVEMMNAAIVAALIVPGIVAGS